MFAQKALYGDMNEFVELLRQEGITEIHYIGNLEKTDLAPKMMITGPACQKNNRRQENGKC